MKISDFWVIRWTFTKFLMSYWNHKSAFLKLFIILQSHERTLLYFFSWSFIWFEQMDPMKVQNFKLLIAHLKFHRICTLIGSFYYDSWHWMVMVMNKKWFVSKLTRIWWILTQALKSLQNLHFHWSLSCKVYNV